MELKAVFETDWSSDAASLPAFWSQQQRMYNTPTWERFVYGLRFKTQRVAHLQVFIQRHIYDEEGVELLQARACRLLAYALENCQRHNSYQEILAVLNAIIQRCHKLGAHVSKHLHALAIHYASLAFSADAMRPHVEEFARRDQKLKGRYSASLSTTSIFSLHSLESPDLQHDMESMRCLIGTTSSTEQLEPHNLHPRLFWGQDIPTHRQELYLPLLAELHMDALLDSVWETIKGNNLAKKNLWPIYLCVVYMVKRGKSSKAGVYLKEISDLFDGTLPNISKMKYLNILLEDEEIGKALPQLAGAQERLGILEAQLQVLERRLGIRWEPGESAHVGLSDPDCNATEKPLFDMDGDTPGYGSNERLVAEIMALGCSKSVEELGRIADLLDDHEGQLVPISTPNEKLEFAWSPERSPIKFSDTPPTLQTDFSKPYPVSSLGLLRIRLRDNQISPAPQYSARIIQLGRLLLRRRGQRRQQRQPGINEWIYVDYDWTPTDYIVGWDRVHARFVLVYASKDEGFQPMIRCASIIPPAGPINTEYTEPWFIGALQQPLRKSHFYGAVEEDPGLDLVD
ncbi:uncharacterized protein LDX57_006106 [Aspergillus melleus]|uniref:uncharacterized protein n=1 Tax=Aspergillus melleus TaxID=138277 RepID=UPI001E8E0391|nr:uncharacterized protein LDX57_006106 [Aspergillus melleus]KAH8428408.1 hypothetical protein LDX57_006106 [Aspergillus melleus]